MTVDKSRDEMVETRQSCIDASILKSLAPTGCILELNENTHMLSLLSAAVPHIIAQQEFTRNEWNILLTLLQSYPHHAPYELLLASITALSSAAFRSRIHNAQQAGAEAFKRELKPVYRALSGVRTKLAKLHSQLQIFLMREVGYVLVKVSE